MKRKVEKYILGEDTNPLLLSGDALEVLKSIPDNSIDCCMTSPPYWQKREYANGGIGLEKKYEEYIDNLVAICMEVHRVLKLTGSFWLNIGDSYKNKCLLNIPWRVAIELTDRGWILRNTIIWNKVKGGMDNSKDRLGNVYEPLFHFVKVNKGYYYDMPFSGFAKYLQEEQIRNYALVLDKEGEQNEASRTMQAACEMGLSNVTEENSKDSYGLRMADMMAGIISKLLKALCDELHYHSIAEGTEKKLLSANWFQLNETQLSLYKKLYKIICAWDNAWYKSYAGIYSDDLVCFIGLLGYMTQFENTEQIINDKLEMQSEYFNGYVCQQLSDCFNRRRSKLPIDFIDKNDEEYFLNRRGAKVYFDIMKQPILQIAEGSQTEMVLSVGMDKSGIPLITVLNEDMPICYRLPEELSDWAYAVIGMANMGENLFPSQVVFTKEMNRYFADVL